MHLFHISDDINQREKTFIPRIPDKIYNGENNTIKRICFSTSMENCMKALYVPLFKKGTKFMLFETKINGRDKNLIHPKELFNKDYVKDAIANDEYWYLKPITLTGELYMVQSIDYEPCMEWKAITVDDIKSILKNLSLDDDDLKNVVNMKFNKSEDYYNEFIRICGEKEKINSIRYCYYEDLIYDTIADQIRCAQGYKINKLWTAKLYF